MQGQGLLKIPLFRRKISAWTHRTTKAKFQHKAKLALVGDRLVGGETVYPKEI